MRKSRRWGWVVVWAFTAIALATAGTGARGETLAIDSVTPSPASVPKYARVELAVALSNVAATKVYDPDPAAGGLDLSATFTSPTSATWNLKGFYDGSSWLVRFAPNETGTWGYSVVASDPSGTSNTATGSFACVASASRGWARIDGRFLRFAEGQALFGVGHNTGWQYDVEQPSLSDMAAKGENLLSFWIAAPWDTPASGPDRAPIENVTQGIGNYNQAACAYLDGVVGRAEAASVYLLPSIWSHGQLRDDSGYPAYWGAGWWYNNAYSTLGSATDFFKTGTSEQWRYQRNFYRYLIARWGYSRAIAGWVNVCEIQGTTGYALAPSQAEAWVLAVRDYFRTNDPFRTNASNQVPVVVTKSDAPTWDGGSDLRATDSYNSQYDNVGVAATIASQTQTMRTSGKPSFHAEFGGNTSGGATQPAHLHNGIWAGAANGAALTPLVWCDGGSFPMLTGAMQDHLQYLAEFMAGLGYFGNSALAKATVTIATPCRGWGMKLADRGYVWVQNTTGTMGGQSLTISGVTAGSYRVLWYDAWTSGAAPFTTSTVTVTYTGKLTVAVPTLARADIACKFAPNTNNPPVANNQSVTTPEDTPQPVTLTATDADGDPLTYSIVAQPAHGTLSGTAPGVTYTPAANYNGPDSFTFKANDGQADSNVATVTITVSPVNDPPVANNQSVTTPEDTPRPVTLTATDADGDPLTYSVVTGPAHGSLSGTPPSVTYAPAADYNGPDSFTFKANDGNADSNVATVTITVSPVNDPPVAEGQSVTTPEDTGVDIALSATDVEGNPLTYSVVAGPAHGTLTGTAPILTYTPSANYNGPDSFTFKANDGQADSNVATVAITITPVNDPPVAVNDSATTTEGLPVTISVLANDSDVDGDELAVTAVTQGSGGVAVINADQTITYTPTPAFAGTDSFSYTISDGHGGTATAEVTVTVNPVNHDPVAQDDAATTDEDTAVAINVLDNDTDPDPGDTLTVLSVTQPVHGSAANNGANVTYTPAANFHGTDSFTYTVSDGKGGSATATVAVTVNSVNDPPVANPQSVTTDEDTAVAITLTATDPDGDPLTYAVVAGPSHGALSGTAPDLTYTPAANYNGPDSFTFKANDGTVDSNEATVSITVNPVNDAPAAVDQAVTTDEDTAKAITLSAADVDGDALTYSIVAGPSHGALSGTAPNVTYTPAANYNGPDSFTFKVNDGTADSNVATVTVTVGAVNDPPIASADAYSTNQNQTLNVAAPGVLGNDTDADGDPLTAILATDPAHGSVTLNADGSFTYTPTTGYSGSDSFTYEAYDGTTLSNETAVTITVNAAGPTAVLSIAMSKTVYASYWKAKATVTVKDAAGKSISSATVAGHWSGVTSGTATGTTNSKGQAAFTSAAIRSTGTATFTVDRVTKNGTTYTLTGVTSGSISGP